MNPNAALKTDFAETLVAIGDIHGRADLLQKLLEKVERRLEGQSYRTVFLGDYVDRGRDSAAVIDCLLAYQETHPDTVFLKGNHEEAMLDFLGAGEDAAAWLGWGGEQTLRSYGIDLEEPVDFDALQIAFAEALPEPHFRFLMDLKRYHAEGAYVFVHAGLDPTRPLEAQRDRDLFWIREPFFNAAEEAFEGRIIVHGHTPVKRPDNLDWRINIDTGAVWSSRLTAVVLKGDRRSFIKT